jgi:ankyrin repeat protein
LEDVSTATVDIDVELDSTVSVPEVVVPIRRFHDFSLQRASASGQLEAVKLAIGKGADVNMPMHGSTALHEASRNGHYDVAKLLISEGADVNALRFGSTALHDAARYGHSDLVKLLITKDADINARNREGSTPLHVAVGYDHPSAAEHVQFHTKVEQRHLVVLHGLISAGADVNAANAVGDAPLHLAARSGQDSLVEFLVFERADVNAVNDVGDTPLHEAARNGQGAVAKFLISEGADVNAANTVGDTPQQLADAFYRDVLVHEAAHGKYADGASPLQLAAASYRGRFAAACDRGTADELERRRRRKRHRRQFPKQSCRPAGGWVPAEVASHTSSPWDILRGMLGGSGGEDRVLNLIRGPFAAWRMHMPDSSLPDLISDLESAYADETAVLCAIAHELASLVPTAKSGQWSATALQGNRTAA